MTALSFVDTNVLVYWRDARDPVKQGHARDWLDVLWREQRGRTSIQVLSEFYSVMTRKAGLRVARDEAWRDVQAMMAWNPQPLDAEVIRRAREIESRSHLSWWDSLIISAAQIQGCATLLTEDLQDGAEYGGVVVRNPFTFGVADEAAAYTPSPKIASRHRGRGRPRKSSGRLTTASS
jgi:predicted nucleic acid-binding protein